MDVKEKEYLDSRYTIVSTLASSSMSLTSLANDRDGNRVILKRIDLKDLDNWKKFDLFEREAMLLQSLSHPRVPRYIEHFALSYDTQVSYYLCYEYIDGESLQEKVSRQGGFPEERVKDILVEVLTILEYLHKRKPPIIHRDINPKNIIETTDGDIYLVDFGAGKNLALESDSAYQTTFIGTYGYAPMEQMVGDAGPESDIYAIGMTAIHLLTGRYPKEFELRELKPFYKSRYDFTPLDHTIDLMIEPDRDKRTADPSELLDLLRSGKVKKTLPEPGSITMQMVEKPSDNLSLTAKGSKEILTFTNTRAKKFESILMKVILDMWIKRPWLSIILGSAITNGLAFIPLIILLKSKKAQLAVKKAYSQYNDVDISVKNGIFSVKNQIKNIPVTQIDNINMRKEKVGTKYRLEVEFERDMGTEEEQVDTFYLTEINDDEIKYVQTFIKSRFDKYKNIR